MSTNGNFQLFSLKPLQDRRWLYLFVVIEPRGSYSTRSSTTNYVSTLGTRQSWILVSAGFSQSLIQASLWKAVDLLHMESTNFQRSWKVDKWHNQWGNAWGNGLEQDVPAIMKLTPSGVSQGLLLIALICSHWPWENFQGSVNCVNFFPGGTVSIHLTCFFFFF